MKIIEIKKRKNLDRGRLIKHGVAPKPHEDRTINHLLDLGFDIELVVPSNIPHSKNPDLEMMGTFWEMKSPVSSDEDTVASKFRKAVKQAGGRAVYDLRNVQENHNGVKECVIRLFKNTRGMTRLILIEKDGRTLDIIK